MVTVVVGVEDGKDVVGAGAVVVVTGEEGRLLVAAAAEPFEIEVAGGVMVGEGVVARLLLPPPRPPTIAGCTAGVAVAPGNAWVVVAEAVVAAAGLVAGGCQMAA